MAGRGVDIILGGNPPVESEQEEIRALGGLHVVGTERHESRRIDNQLRGRAGRQGDPGSSQFYVSTEDDLMRIFGGDRMKGLMQTLNVPADMPIENKMISKSIESAQKKVEGNNFDTRKQLVEYDDVINKHRTAIYNRRREILEIAEGKEVKEIKVSRTDEDEESNQETKVSKLKTLTSIISEMVNNEIRSVVNFHTAGDNQSEWNIKEIYETMRTIWVASPEVNTKLEEFIKENKYKDEIREEIINYLVNEATHVYEVLVERFASAGVEFIEVEKGILIRSIDQLWVEHLETVDYLRRGIGLRGYGQRDPLVEYKKEAWLLYQELNGLINKNVVYAIYRTGDGLAMANTQEIKMFADAPETKLEFTGAQKEMHKQAEERNTIDLVHEKIKSETGEKVGRNDPCPCGSGKKYKNCHGK
jgi:preprotein translocase subunit SecA